MLRAFVAGIWIFAAVIVWLVIVFLLGSALAWYGNTQQVLIPGWIVTFVNIGLTVIGTLIVGIAAGLLAVRGKIPGTVPMQGTATKPPL